MITHPTAFTDKVGHHSGVNGIVISLTDGVSTFLLGNMEIDLTDGHVFDVLKDEVSVSQKLDDVKNTWSRTDIQATFTNIWYKRDSTGEKVILSDELVGVAGNTAKVYLYNNSLSTSLSDCALIFTGEVQNIENYSETEIRVNMLDSGGFLDKQLVPNSMIGTFANASDRSKFLKQPLVYGVFSRTPEVNGLARVPISHFQGAFLIANHLIHSFDDLYVVNGQDVPPFEVPFELVTYQPAAAGAYPIITWNPDDEGNLITSERFDLNPNNSDRTDPLDDTTAYGDVLYNWFALDLDISTGAKIFISYKDPLVYQVYGAAGYEIYEASRLKRMFLESEISPVLWLEFVNLEHTSTHNLATGPGFIVAAGQLIYNTNPTKIYYKKNISAADFILNADAYSNQDVWKIVKLATPADLDSSNRDFGFALWVRIWSSPIILDDLSVGDELAEIGEMFLTLKGVFSSEINSELSSGLNAGFGWVACHGREYDTWADNAAWSGTQTYNLASGEVIKEANGIIMSLLIDEAGKAVTDFDNASFVDSLSYSMSHRLNVIDEDMTIKDAIIQLSEQTPSTFIWTAAGKARMIPLRTNAQDATSDKTFTYDDLVGGKITISETDAEDVVNSLTIKSRWLAEEQRFVDEHNFINQTSIDDYGRRHRNLEFKNTCANSSETVLVHNPAWIALHLIDADEIPDDNKTQTDDGYWANQWGLLNFTVCKHSGSACEIGDIIDFDTTMDGHLLFNGATWASKNFRIISITHTGQNTTITAKELPLNYKYKNGLRSLTDLITLPNPFD
jgi:hypothetical protein